jgi:CRISPR system Cascade subunit CasC
MLIEVHILQNFVPANLNRDDTNTPKDCEFGGVRRARISSQCLKRAIRMAPVFEKTTGVELGTRSKWLVRLLSDRLMKNGKPQAEIDTALSVFVPKYFSKLDKDKVRTAVLLYFSAEEVDDMAKVVEENWAILLNADNQAKLIDQLVAALVKKNKGNTSAPDIAMFGRMLAEKPELNLDAACQVAHALSTHRINMELDFYTAVDDLNREEEAGAGMMGFVGFNSACFYRYACIHWEQLVTNLRGDKELAKKTVEGFLRASIEAVPSGKQATFAANNPPSFVLAAVRENGSGWSLANAFEKPVHITRDGGYVACSVQALDEYWGQLTKVYGDEGVLLTAALPLEDDLPVKHLVKAIQPDLKTWISKVMEALPSG